MNIARNRLVKSVALNLEDRVLLAAGDSDGPSGTSGDSGGDASSSPGGSSGGVAGSGASSSDASASKPAASPEPAAPSSSRSTPTPSTSPAPDRPEAPAENAAPKESAVTQSSLTENSPASDNSDTSVLGPVAPASGPETEDLAADTTGAGGVSAPETVVAGSEVDEAQADATATGDRETASTLATNGSDTDAETASNVSASGGAAVAQDTVEAGAMPDAADIVASTATAESVTNADGTTITSADGTGDVVNTRETDTTAAATAVSGPDTTVAAEADSAADVAGQGVGDTTVDQDTNIAAVNPAATAEAAEVAGADSQSDFTASSVAAADSVDVADETAPDAKSSYFPLDGPPQTEEEQAQILDYRGSQAREANSGESVELAARNADLTDVEAQDTATAETSNGSASGQAQTSYSEEDRRSVRLPGGAFNENVVSSDAPVVSTPDNEGYFRTGQIRRGAEFYEGDPLEAFRQGEAADSSTGRLHNPYRDDGSADAPQQFDFETSFLTEGNTFNDGNGNVIPGESGGAYYRNSSDQNVIVTAGLLPGNEQPGQAITVVRPGDQQVQAVRSPAANEGLRNGGNAEIYASVGNVDPTQVTGWHYSDARPNDDPTESDFGTPQFPFKLDVNTDTEGAIFASLGSNEGFDPSVTGDPGYGVTLHGFDGATGQKGELLGVTYVANNDGTTAEVVLTGRSFGNPASNADNANLSIGTGQISSGEFLFEFVTPEEARRISEQQQGNPAFTTVRHQHRAVDEV